MLKSPKAIDPAAAGSNVGGTRCSRLCFLLAGLGLGLTSAASVFTYNVLHELMESLGASVVDHLVSSKCTAINATLAALSVARSDVLNGEAQHERSTQTQATITGVVTPADWAFEDYQASGIPQHQVLKVLQQLPPQALSRPTPTTVASAIERGPRELAAELDQYNCNLGYGLNPSAVKVYRIPSLTQTKQHGGHHQDVSTDDSSNPWMAFLYGPWTTQGNQKVAFALVNLNTATMQVSGHDHNLNDLFPGETGLLSMEVHLSELSTLQKRQLRHQVMSKLDEGDHKLLGIKVVPFANGLLRTEMSIDHAQLNRVPIRTATLVFLIGLFATTAVVLVSRRSELTLRVLNEALMKESRTDGLTRVANRRAWDEALSMEEGRRQRYGHSYGLVVVDLDDFKQINDQQGHQAGDQALQIAAAQLSQQLRDTDLLARVGGDEFALLIFHPTPAGLSDLIKRLRAALHKAGVQASIGAALSKAQATLEQTWAEADEAMYRVKTTGNDPSSLPSNTSSV